MRAVLIPPTGTATELRLSPDPNTRLQQLQAIVGGYIQMVPYQDRQDAVVVLNEEGKFMNLPHNEKATSLVVGLMPGDYIAGYAVVLGVDPPDEMPLPEDINP